MPKLSPTTFENLLSAAREAIEEEGFSLSAQEAIPFGQAQKLNGGGQVNIYNGRKGASFVLGGGLLEADKLRLEVALRPLFASMPSEETTAADGASNLFNLDQPWAGVDESGKGDYFGPLVVAGVVVRPADVDELLKAGVRDSKSVSNPQALALSTLIERRLPVSVVRLMPPVYNARYAEYRNLNKMLTDLHAEVARRLAARVSFSTIISDQFADPKKLRRALDEAGIEATLKSITKGERDVAVAAASIVARAHFLEGVRELSNEATFDLPLGAGDPVLKVGRKLVQLFGSEELGRYAKLHFKTTQTISP